MKTLLLAGALALCFVTTADARSHHSGWTHTYRSSGPYERDLMTHNRYNNVSGHSVHSPSRTYSGRRPAGATAHCSDGSWSFSEHARGTCSHHGGIG